jgi:hypothetical protein
MALSQNQLLTLVGVLVVLFAVMVYNNIVAMQARRKQQGGTGKKTSSGDRDGPAVHPMIAKFARHEGSIVGEGIAIADDRLILKQAGIFKSVPLAQADVIEDEIVLTGPIDWKAAEEAGAAWHAGHRAAADMDVSGTLTRSEDVKAPAMDAVRERDQP